MNNASLYIDLNPGILCYYKPNHTLINGVLEFKNSPLGTLTTIRELATMTQWDKDVKQGGIYYSYSVFRKLFEIFGVNERSIKIAMAIAEVRLNHFLDNYEIK